MNFFHPQTGYILSEAFRSLGKSPISSITTILTIGVCTSVLGILMAGGALLLAKVDLNQRNYELRLFVAQDFESPKSLERIEADLRKIPGLDSIVFISKSEALEEFQKDYDQGMVEAIDFNPLPPSFIIYPGKKYQTSSSSKTLRSKLLDIKGGEAVSSAPPYLAWLDKWSFPLISLSGFFILFVSSAIALVISNSIKLNLYARQDLVKNMKYCGASNSFITLPFLFEGMLMGTAGSLFGIISIALINKIFTLLLPDYSARFQWQTWTALIVFTCALSIWASADTVKKFLLKN